MLSHPMLQDIAAWELLGLYAGELWLDADIDAEQAKVPCGAGLLMFDKQMDAEVVDRSGRGEHGLAQRMRASAAPAVPWLTLKCCAVHDVTICATWQGECLD